MLAALQAVAQGRVWTGQRALQRQLVDVLGGLHEAVALVKQAAGIAQDEKVTLLEVSRSRTSPLKLLGEWQTAVSVCYVWLACVLFKFVRRWCLVWQLQGQQVVVMRRVCIEMCSIVEFCTTA
eukprot:GHRQ01022850.1.p2 GENE.GHRQ01022850.1~~GHRQ01022850.1.p2  ORF type:complete len:123 (-),score=43.07 GHRQ01022850.1:262-630(-)